MVTISQNDIYLFNEGTHLHLYRILGAHPTFNAEHEPGVHFAVWAPNAYQVFVIGNFNGWNRTSHPLSPQDSSGIWTGFIKGLENGEIYKYFIVSHHNNMSLEKADPLGFFHETPPATASIVWEKSYSWNDQHWINIRGQRQSHQEPLSIYELHIGSWRRVPEDSHRSLTYRELAEPLASYIKEMGFTHVEFMPITEHPFYGSWGYQTTGYFAPTSRYGTPEDLKFLIDFLHQHEIGVILDWVPSHFPTDGHGLAFFDGTHLYEHADPQLGFHPDWNSAIFNYGRHEVRSFLLSSAFYWLEVFHIDALRVDAVASMLYLDYSRKAGEWIPNRYGGRENLEAIDLLRQLNEKVYKFFPDVQMIAEESTSWGMVSKPTYLGGLGFGYKWDMGWMHDTLFYFSHDPIYRSYHHNQLTFRMLYAYTENFILPLSHDEVVHGKGSLIGKMPGDDWQKFASLRLLFGYQFTQPGKKLIFMGGELAQWSEWNHESSIEWHLLQYTRHQGMQRWVKQLNHIYREEPALHQLDTEQAGFEWIDCADYNQSIISYLRLSAKAKPLLIIVNAIPSTHFQYNIGVPSGGLWQEILNSDEEQYGGSGKRNPAPIEASMTPLHNRPFALTLIVPPLSVIILKPHS